MNGHSTVGCSLGRYGYTGDSPCHIPLQGSGTQLALYQELAGPEGNIAAFSGACTHTHGRVPGSTTVVKIEHYFARPSFTSPPFHLEKEPSSHILIGSDNTTIGCTSARRGCTLSVGSSPFVPVCGWSIQASTTSWRRTVLHSLPGPYTVNLQS